jgi:hypothetical protein
MPYGFYELIRFSAFAGFGYLAILEFQKRNTNGLIIYVVLALLFQPFVKVALERELWNIIDVSVAIGLIINTIYTFYKSPRNKSMNIKNIDKRILAREFLFTLGYLISISLIYVIVIFADDNNESQLRKLRKKIISLELPSESFINDAYNLGSYSIYSWDDNPRRTFKEFQTEASYNWQLVSKLYREYQKSYEDENGWREFSLSREKFNNLIGYRFYRLGENNKMNEDYIETLYEFISSDDPSYKQDLSFDKFKSSMEDRKYASEMYEFISSQDPSYKQDVSLNDFIDVFQKNKNEKALQTLFGLAKGDGYTKSFDEFKQLMSENKDALKQMYGLAKGDGYQKDISQFKTLVGFEGSDIPKATEAVEEVKKNEPTAQEQNVTVQKKMNELQKLYKLLRREGYYTKSYGEFEQKYNNDNAYRDKVFSVVSRDGHYTKSKDEFFQKYAVSQPEVTEAVEGVKKTEPPVINLMSKEEETKLKKLDAEILSRVERAGDPYRNYLWNLSVGILAIVFGMRYLIYATLWSLKQIKK